jgi:hypothetical protein
MRSRHGGRNPTAEPGEDPSMLARLPVLIRIAAWTPAVTVQRREVPIATFGAPKESSGTVIAQVSFCNFPFAATSRA